MYFQGIKQLTEEFSGLLMMNIASDFDSTIFRLQYPNSTFENANLTSWLQKIKQII